jgi:hypothetical protein
MAYRRGDNDRPEVLGHGFIEATTWGEGMSGDHNMHQKPRSYLDEHEPVAWMFVNEDGECEQIEYGPVFDDPGVTPLYTSPPKREWVGLTLNEAEEFYDKYTDRAELINAIDKFLEEKNT